jgi:hypothetical protein
MMFPPYAIAGTPMIVSALVSAATIETPMPHPGDIFAAKKVVAGVALVFAEPQAQCDDAAEVAEDHDPVADAERCVHGVCSIDGEPFGQGEEKSRTSGVASAANAGTFRLRTSDELPPLSPRFRVARVCPVWPGRRSRGAGAGHAGGIAGATRRARRPTAVRSSAVGRQSGLVVHRAGMVSSTMLTVT